MLDVKEYCSLLYHSLRNPVYLYENNSLILNLPQQENSTLPTQKYLDLLWSSDKTLTCIMTEFYSYYGGVTINNTDYRIVLGPVNDVYYTKEAIHQISNDFSVNVTESFTNFFMNIPIVNIIEFLGSLNLINYTFNLTKFSREEIDGFFVLPEDIKVKKSYSDYAFSKKEDGAKLYAYYLGEELARYVETGNLDGIKQYLHSSEKLPDTLLAGTKLRHYKNMFISMITLVSNAAIRGGLSPIIASMKSEIYIQQVERIMNPEMISSLNSQALTDFTSQVAETKIPKGTPSDILQAIYFVKENTHNDISVAEVSEHVGFSRNYFSERFKVQMGIGLSDYIRKCKLEEAKELLKYSNKSISEISSFLSFSSQSHFQKAFKKLYAITPYVYKKTSAVSL